MENFAEMLEEYLNEDEINYKKKLDDIKETQKNTISKFKHNFENTISIYEFVNDYLEVEHNCENLKHMGLKSFNSPYIIGVSNDFAIKNKEYVLKNEILIVVDAYNNPAAYINPILLKQITTMEELKYTMGILEKIRLNDLVYVKKLYDKFDLITKQINQLNTFYLQGNELLKRLNKKSILREIKNYVKEMSESKDEINVIQSEIENTINLEYTLIDKIDDNLLEKKEGKTK